MRFFRSSSRLLSALAITSTFASIGIAEHAALGQTRAPAAPATAPPALPAARTPAAPSQPAPLTGSGSSVAQPAGTPESNAPVEIPAPPTVDDPMLAPMPAAPTSIANWQEALKFVRARSTDLRIAYDEVKRAEAQQRVALGTALTQINAQGALTKNLLTETIDQKVPTGGHLVPVTNADGTPGLPTIALDYATVPITVPTSAIIATASATAVQPIFAPRQWHQIGTAKVSTEAAKLSMEDLKRTVVLGVANALVGVVTSERVAELNRVGFRNALERLALTQRRRALGAANGLDVVRSQQDVETARATLVTGDESLRQAREALGLAIGLPQQVGVTKDINIDGLERDAQNACRVAPSIDERADVKAAAARVRVARRNIDDVWLQFSPSANLQSTLATNSYSQFQGPKTTWNIQAVLTVPIWDGGQRYGFLRDARAFADEQDQNVEALRRKATIEVEQARRSVDVAEQSRKVAADARALAAETDRLTQAGYREGQGTSLELVVAASALRQADINLALREFDAVKARVAAVLALATCPF
jgi:multidrug efflux system outer membrane protein